MEAISKLFLLSLRKKTLENENARFVTRIERDKLRIESNDVQIEMIEFEAEILNGELKEQQQELYKFGTL